jgi:hypothetical protein
MLDEETQQPDNSPEVQPAAQPEPELAAQPEPELAAQPEPELAAQPEARVGPSWQPPAGLPPSRVAPEAPLELRQGVLAANEPAGRKVDAGPLWTMPRQSPLKPPGCWSSSGRRSCLP